MNQFRRIAWWGIGLWLLVWWTGCQQAPGVNANETLLVDLMAQRLEIARDVAWNKFNTGAPVLDAPREQAVLMALVSQAGHAGIEPPAATAFFTAQIAASRQVQTELIENWNRGAPRPTTTPLDLAAVIRPRLDVIGEKLVAVLTTTQAARIPRARVQAALEAKGFSAATAKRAAEGLSDLRPK